MAEVRQIQRNLLLAYEQDFSKHIADKQTVQRVRQLWYALPEQLAKENKKICVFSDETKCQKQRL